MTLVLDTGPGKWARSCPADGSTFDYCSALGMGDFKPQAWNVDANDGNYLQTIFVRNDPDGLIASIDTTPAGSIYGPDSETGTILATSTFSGEGEYIISYTPGIGDFNIAGVWSVEILGIQVTLKTGDTCSVNFYQTFDGGPVNFAPEITAATVTGNRAVGQTLTANYTYSDADDTENVSSTVASIEWYRYDAATGTAGETLLATGTTTYTVVAGDATKFIGYKITPYANSGPSPGTEVDATRVQVFAEVYSGSTTKQTDFRIQMVSDEAVIDWGDGSAFENVDFGGSINSELHTYASPGTYNWTVYGDPANITRIDMNQQNLTGTLDFSGATSSAQFRSNNNSISAITHPASTPTITFYYAYSNSSLTSLDLTGVDIGGDTRIYSTGLTSFTSGSSTEAFTKFHFYGNTSIATVDVSAYTGLAGEVWFYNNTSMTTLTNPASSGSITYYRVTNTGISSLDISGLTLSGLLYIYTNSSLATLTAPSSTGSITDFRAYSCALGYFDLSGWTFDSAANIQLEDNGMTAAEVNHFLVDLDSALGAGTGSIDISGTNAAPDGSSGGYDGSTAVTNLTSNGWTVTTS